MKGRSIIENVLLAREIISNISKEGKPTNVVLKLDMEKTYDRLDWSSLIMVLEGMSFDANVVDNVWRLVGNN